jgi:hypothetical protein
MLACVAGFLLLLACGFACAGFLLVALFSLVMWLFTNDAHAFRMMLGYSGYAGGVFAATTALSYYYGKWRDGVRTGRERCDPRFRFARVTGRAP